MRPVVKWKIGENGVKKIYKPYSKAKPILKDNFGIEPYYYCNYCDRKVLGINIEVEHILPVSKYLNKKFDWNNFLLSCKSCNGIKLNINFRMSEVVLPHKNNTLKCFNFNNDGTIKPKGRLSHSDLKKVKKTIKLLGLDIGKLHVNKKPQDDRYNERMEVLRISKIKFAQYKNKKQDLEDIINCAKTSGFWAVWYDTFKNEKKVTSKLIKEFKNTYSECRSKNIYRC